MSKSNIETLKEKFPELVDSYSKMTKEELLEACCGEVLDLNAMTDRVQLFMIECTPNMSKTNYKLDVLKKLISEKQEQDLNEFCFDILEEGCISTIEEVKKRANIFRTDVLRETAEQPMQNESGVELIAYERLEQIEKHGRTIEHDQNNRAAQLISAAVHLIGRHTVFDFDNTEDFVPIDWDEAIYQKMQGKSYKERLIISGALIAAEIDRLNNQPA